MGLVLAAFIGCCVTCYLSTCRWPCAPQRPHAYSDVCPEGGPCTSLIDRLGLHVNLESSLFRDCCVMLVVYSVDSLGLCHAPQSYGGLFRTSGPPS